MGFQQFKQLINKEECVYPDVALADVKEFIHNFGDIIAMAERSLSTKGNILKITASFFDPLGLISPTHGG